jgi:hypothetical protein
LARVHIFLARQVLHVDRHQHVVDDVPPRQQQRILEHDADIAMGFGDLVAVDVDFAGCRRKKARDQFEQRGLAAAGWADHDEELAVIDVEVQGTQRLHLAVAGPIGFGDAGEIDPRRL